MKKLATLVTLVLALAMLTVSASAANFTPSVERKPAPTVTSAVTADGTAIDLVVTPVSAKDSAASPEIAEKLESAYAQIQAAASLTDLVPDIGTALSKIDSSLSVSDLVVRDLFDISYTDGSDATGSVTAKLQTDLAAGTPVLVLHNYEGTNWEVLPTENVSLDNNGVLTITVDSLSPFAIVVPASANTSSGTSPQTGESISNAALLASAAFIGLAGIFVVMSRKSANR